MTYFLEEQVARISYRLSLVNQSQQQDIAPELAWKPKFLGKPRLHRLRLLPPLTSAIAEIIFQQFGLGYLICDKFPRSLETDFRVLPSVRSLISKMYVFHGRKPPAWREHGITNLKDADVESSLRLMGESRDLSPQKVIVTLSGGKDGLYYLLRAIENYGKENVLPVHLARLSMEGVSHRELAAAKKLAKLLDIDIKVIEFTNSTRIPGPRIMNFRDIFLMAMLAGQAHKFGAKKIFIEGSDDAEGSGDPYFSDLDSSEKAMLQILREWGIDVKVESESVSEYEVLRRMYVNPAWAKLMPYTHSCLRCDRLMMFCRWWYEDKFPQLFKCFYEGQCGSCFKCRVITLARMLWDNKLRRVPKKELKEYVARTEEWREKLGRKHKGSWDFVNDPSLLRLLAEAKEYVRAK